ncbi:hypothetical protein TNCV_393241 [Trichonephila clavipes]|nr:hypothetical protein TNCV_393241 [Trichonephila clavipes]
MSCPAYHPSLTSSQVVIVLASLAVVETELGFITAVNTGKLQFRVEKKTAFHRVLTFDYGDLTFSQGHSSSEVRCTCRRTSFKDVLKTITGNFVRERRIEFVP